MSLLKFFRENIFLTSCLILIAVTSTTLLIFQFTTQYPPSTSCYSPNGLPYHYFECHQQGYYTPLDFIMIYVGGGIVLATFIIIFKWRRTK